MKQEPKYPVGTRVYIRPCDKVKTVVAHYDYAGEWGYSVEDDNGVMDTGYREDELYYE